MKNGERRGLVASHRPFFRASGMQPRGIRPRNTPKRRPEERARSTVLPDVCLRIGWGRWGARAKPGRDLELGEHSNRGYLWSVLAQPENDVSPCGASVSGVLRVFHRGGDDYEVCFSLSCAFSRPGYPKARRVSSSLFFPMWAGRGVVAERAVDGWCGFWLGFLFDAVPARWVCAGGCAVFGECGEEVFCRLEYSGAGAGRGGLVGILRAAALGLFFESFAYSPQV